MQRGIHQVARFGGFERDFDRLAVAHFADQNHFGRLAQGGAQSERETGRVAVQFALMNRGAFCAQCRNSIGSSMVMMWQAFSSLILFKIAASVDDLPLPVGPVTSTMPLRRWAASAKLRRQGSGP